MDIFLNGNNFLRLLQGVGLSLQIVAISIVISCFFGFILGFLMTRKNIFLRILCRFYLESMRIVPILVWLFIVFFGLSLWLDRDISALQSAIIVFCLWGSAEIGDLARGAFSSIPKHQFESSRALGLNEWQLNLFVILPQSLQSLAPAILLLITRMIKTTSLVALLGAVDLLKVGQQIMEANKHIENASLYIYGGIFITYFLLCYPLSLLSKYLERKYQ